MAAHQASPSLGFSRQEHRIGLSFLSPMHESEPGVPVASQEEALSTGKAKGTPGSCHQSQSPRLRHEDLFKMILFFNSFLILAVVGLCCCTRAFSGCGEWGPRSSCSPRASPCGGFSYCRARAPDTWASVLCLSGSRPWVQ